MTIHRGLLFCLALAACASTPSSSGDSTDAGQTDDKLDLDTCTTSIGADAPEFYRRYFRCLTVTTSGDSVVLTGDGRPPHQSPYYPSSSPNHVAWDSSRGSEYHQNPNDIASTSLRLTIPNSPVSRGLTVASALVDGTVGTSQYEYAMGGVGAALDGVELFNSMAAPGDDIAREVYTFDDYSGHPQQQGVYHYHSASPGPLEVLAKAGLVTKTTPGEAEVELYGIMCDGTVVLGCTELDGSAPDDADFDAQNGHVKDLVATDGTVMFAGRYHVHVCASKWPNHPYTPEIQYYSTCTTH